MKIPDVLGPLYDRKGNLIRTMGALSHLLQPDYVQLATTPVRAVSGAMGWYGPDYGDPVGWDKDPGTKRWNPDSLHAPEYAL